MRTPLRFPPLPLGESRGEGGTVPADVDCRLWALGTPFGWWGYDDVMTGVDHAIGERRADPVRLICYGWSYGQASSPW